MKNNWRIINTALVVLSALSGYWKIGKWTRPPQKEDWIACPLIVIGALLFSFVMVWYRREEKMQRPLWTRSPWNWADDPLQSLYITTWICCSWTIGCGLHLWAIGSRGLLTVAMFFSLLIGLLLGQLLIYKIYSRRITEKRECGTDNDS
jgi:protein-S-isoprenylcysteine O-methyltransferase Ste14